MAWWRAAGESDPQVAQLAGEGSGDPGLDFAALQPRLSHLFGDRVTDIAISNGVEAHDPERYLSAAQTGAAILAGLRG